MNLKWVSGNSNLFKGTKMFHLVGASKSRISRICVVFTSDLGFDSECSLSKSNFSFIVLEQHPSMRHGSYVFFKISSTPQL